MPDRRTTPWTSGSASSEEAAGGVERRQVGTIETVFNFINVRKQFGATDDEMMAWFRSDPYNWGESTARGRRLRLAKAGRIRKKRDAAGKLCYRPTRHGERGVVWVVNDEAEPDLFDASDIVQSWRVKIPSDVPSQNELEGVNRGHTTKKKHAVQRLWYALMMSAFREVGATQANERRALRVTRHHHNRRDELDPPNLVGGFKWILDMLTRPRGEPGTYSYKPGLGYLVDDHKRWLHITFHQKPDCPRGAMPWTELELMVPRTEASDAPPDSSLST